jgi:hypothetical protein
MHWQVSVTGGGDSYSRQTGWQTTGTNKPNRPDYVYRTANIS